MIRHAKPDDHPAIRAVVEAAFGKAEEANLVERLRAGGDVMFELVDEDDGEIVGHILYSRLWADSVNLYAALAPLAVRPDRQRTGVGKRLTAASIETAKDFGAQMTGVTLSTEQRDHVVIADRRRAAPHAIA